MNDDRPRSPVANPGDTTIVTCIEAGGLEDQVILLARSLRRLGGRFAQTPIVAIKARSGPAIRTSTRIALTDLDVHFVDQTLNRENAWWAHRNKPAALGWADRELSSTWLTWMDSDMLFLREPDAFPPPVGSEFIARAGEAFDVASSGSDAKAPFWQAVCTQQNLDFSAFPTITSFPDGKAIRAYWQGGIFTFRRGGGFVECYGKAMDDLLAGSIGSQFAGVYHTDQVSLAVAVQSAGLTAAEYAPTMNLNLNESNAEPFGRYPIDQVKVVHYHGSLWPQKSDWAIARLSPLSDEQRDVLAGLVPLSAGGRFLRLQRRIYDLARSQRVKAYKARALPI